MNVFSVRLMVDYIKGIKTSNKLLEEVKTWPLIDITTALTAPGESFILRTDFTLKSKTVENRQAAGIAAAPYAIRLTYTVAN